MYRNFDKMLEMLFPGRCPVCDDIVVPRGRLICLECLAKVSFVKEPCCRKCGKEIIDDRGEYCPDCRQKPHYFDWGASAVNYDSVGRKIISDFKYHNKRDNSVFLAHEIVKRCGQQIKLMEGDALMPVPLYWWKKRVRGFNQSEVLAKRLEELTGIPVYRDMIVRIRNTRPQKSLEHLQRRKNLMEAFRIGNIPEGIRSVILVDDIYTTGSTIDACSRMLKSAGVEKVYFVSACIGKNY